MNGNEPETKGNIKQCRSGDDPYNRPIEAIKACETVLLQVFDGYAALNERRMTQQDANIAVFLRRTSTFETRLLEVEKRLNVPPAV